MAWQNGRLCDRGGVGGGAVYLEHGKSKRAV